MNYLCAALFSALLLLGWLYTSTSGELTTTKQSLAVAIEANETNRAAIARLERNIENTDKILAGWNEDRTTLAGIRSTTRQAIREAMRDETFKVWASGVVPADAWRLLREASNSNANGNVSSVPASGVTGGLSGNSDSGKRQ